jgi:hypothetical protein
MQAFANISNRRSNSYQKVFDSRKRRVRGLWRRSGRFYANLIVSDDLGRKSSQWVTPAGATLSEALKNHRKLQAERGEKDGGKGEANDPFVPAFLANFNHGYWYAAASRHNYH